MAKLKERIRRHLLLYISYEKKKNRGELRMAAIFAPALSASVST
jgi:hypothetical protein